jgi:hypothetical protein
MLNAIHAECRNAECRYAECRGAVAIVERSSLIYVSKKFYDIGHRTVNYDETDQEFAALNKFIKSQQLAG